MAAKVIRPGPLDLFLLGYVKGFVFSVSISSLSHMEQRTKQAIECTGTQILEKIWKNMSARTTYVLRADGGHAEQGDVRLKHVQCFYYTGY